MKDYIPHITTYTRTRPKYKQPFYWIIAGIMSVPVAIVIFIIVFARD